MTGSLARPTLAALIALCASTPAAAQWAQVADVPTTQLFSLWAGGDTLAAGADTAVYISTNAGGTWHATSKPVAGVTSIQAVRVRNGRLYAGTFGQGVQVSDDLGASWQAFNQGLVGGILDTQLDIVALEVRGDSLYAATAGAGVYVRGFAPAGTWQHFGDTFEPNQASNVNDLARGGARLLALAGSNGQVFRHDPGDPDWTISNLDNHGIHAGLTPFTAIHTSTAWVVGSNLGIFTSTAGEEPWTRTDVGLGPLNWTPLATDGSRIFAAFDIAPGVIIEQSDDNGLTWQELDGFAGVFVKSLALVGGELYAARGDGLWRNAVALANVPPTAAPGALRLAMAGPQPFTDRARLRFELPAAGAATLEVFDVSGRRVLEQVRGSWTAGEHVVAVESRSLAPGVYAARLTSAGSSATLRLVHVR
jgi:hypothetical protein